MNGRFVVILLAENVADDIAGGGLASCLDRHGATIEEACLKTMPFKVTLNIPAASSPSGEDR